MPFSQAGWEIQICLDNSSVVRNHSPVWDKNCLFLCFALKASIPMKSTEFSTILIDPYKSIVHGWSPDFFWMVLPPQKKRLYFYRKSQEKSACSQKKSTHRGGHAVAHRGHVASKGFIWRAISTAIESLYLWLWIYGIYDHLLNVYIYIYIWNIENS